MQRSRIHFTSTKVMNKLISTKNRIFVSLVGPSDSGKTYLIQEWLKFGTFQPKFRKNNFFFNSFNHSRMSCKKNVNLEFIQGVNFDFINSLKNNGTKYLLNFNDSCAEICNFKAFMKVATAVRHRGFSTYFIKHHLFYQSQLGRDVELQNTHIALFESPRDVPN